MNYLEAIDLPRCNGFGISVGFPRSWPDEAFFVEEMDNHFLIYQQSFGQCDERPGIPMTIGVTDSESDALNRAYDKVLEIINKYEHYSSPFKIINKISRARKSATKDTLIKNEILECLGQ